MESPRFVQTIMGENNLEAGIDPRPNSRRPISSVTSCNVVVLPSSCTTSPSCRPGTIPVAMSVTTASQSSPTANPGPP